MKLTNSQIEEQRVKFEEWFMPTFGWNRCFLSEDNKYLHSEVENRFITWLACREANNEITLPASSTKLNHFDDPIKIFYKSGLIESLESQGFTVKGE